MADFRKWFYALAMVALVVGLTVPMSAQGVTTTCNSSSAPPLVRAEGYTELVGDYVLTCTGGTPTAAGQPVTQVNLTVFLTTNITSKITAGGLYDEALLIIDEPNTPTNPTRPILNCGATGAADTGISGPGVCSIVSDGNPSHTYSGAGGNGNYGSGNPNIFQGRLGIAQNAGQNNIVVFNGVPFDPPGTSTTRTLRITNIRADAEFTGVASTFAQAQIQMNVAFNGTQPITINQPQLIVAYVQHGLIVSAATGSSGITGVSFGANLGFLQCNSENPKALTTAGSYGTSYFDNTQAAVRFQEGFASSWKPRNIALMLSNGTANGVGAWQYNGTATFTGTDAVQNVPGANYSTESGFEFNSSNTALSPNPPSGVSSAAVPANGSVPLSSTSTGINQAGSATQGTRLALSLGNVPQGVSLFVLPVLYLYRQNNSSGSSVLPYVAGNVTGVAVLTSTDVNSDTAFSAAITATTPAGALVQVSSSNLVVYEVLFADPNSLEQMDVPIVVSYVSNLTANPPVGLPVTGTPATAAGSFAPFYSTAAARQPQTTTAYPIPRFVPGTTPINIIEITKCACDLLFPYVASAGGFDTGIAIANTSLDPGASFGFGATPQQGGVQFWYYGTVVGGGATPGSQTSNIVPAGGVLTYVLSNGGGAVNSSAGSTANGLSGVPGLVGYVIAQAGFQYCHAFAFISALGAGPTGNGISEGYLGIVLDNGIVNGFLPRTTQRAENDAH